LNAFLDDPRILALQRAMALERPRLLADVAGLKRAAVALVVRPAVDDLMILLIERLKSASDPWSGHMAFPGGRRDGGESDFETAIRETAEEVGVDLGAAGALLGRLDDVKPSHAGARIAVAAFVFCVPSETAVSLSPREVAASFWVPLKHLSDPASAAEHLQVMPGGGRSNFPAVSYHGHVIWGLTYRILMQFMEIARLARQEPVS
jgi:8-oxo-dGTP pyrophosphatase MutT (NUDIX family)